MALNFARQLAGHRRSSRADRHVGLLLTSVAGATNAGAFLAVHQYTSHVTGMVSSMADHVILGAWAIAGASLGAIVAFMLGSACCALLVNFGRRRQWHSEYACPLLLEAALLSAFGMAGGRLAGLNASFVPVTVALLCFSMGLQNALITKLSRAEIRTTHVTGIVTDIGIELGKLVYRNGRSDHDLLVPRVIADRRRLALLGTLLAGFLVGALAGAWAFNRFGYVAILPLALVLAIVAGVPVWDDFAAWRRGKALVS